MRRFLLLLFSGLLAFSEYTQAQATFRSQCPDPTSYWLRMRSREATGLTGTLEVQFVLTARRAFTFADSVAFRVGNTGMRIEAGTQLSRTEYNAPGDSGVFSAVLHYNPAALPYAPVHVQATIYHRSKAGGSYTSLAEGYVYFTPYGTVEVWGIAEFTRLRRKWILDAGPTAQRKSIARALIPESDVPANYQARDDEQFRWVSTPGLSYKVPMLWPDSTQWLDDSTARRSSGCNWPRHTFRGQISWQRITTSHNPDGPYGTSLPAVLLGVKGVEVEIRRQRDLWDETIMTVYTDNDGYLVHNGSRTFDFDKCATGSTLDIYLRINLRDQSNRVRVKDDVLPIFWTVNRG
ncbi:MAG: hypothetical protein H7330_07825 [Hymenobacteraceae bacterium]|nr:hypothetical protein [Hymenobacteraceae bacterium]